MITGHANDSVRMNGNWACEQTNCRMYSLYTEKNGFIGGWNRNFQMNTHFNCVLTIENGRFLRPFCFYIPLSLLLQSPTATIMDLKTFAINWLSFFIERKVSNFFWHTKCVQYIFNYMKLLQHYTERTGRRRYIELKIIWYLAAGRYFGVILNEWTVLGWFKGRIGKKPNI